jgi:hypothetical protein
MALLALSSKVQVPRWMSATAASAGAGVKSPGSQPEVEFGGGVGFGGITTSLVGTTTPVTSPLPEKS